MAARGKESSWETKHDLATDSGSREKKGEGGWGGGRLVLGNCEINNQRLHREAWRENVTASYAAAAAAAAGDDDDDDDDDNDDNDDDDVDDDDDDDDDDEPPQQATLKFFNLISALSFHWT